MNKILTTSLTRQVFILSAFLSLIGVLAVLSATVFMGAAGTSSGHNSLYFFLRQGGACVMGWILAFVIAKKIDLDKCRGWLAIPFSLLAVALCVCALFSDEVLGAHRWIRIGPLQFQVAEAAKLAVILLWADYFSRHPVKDFVSGNFWDCCGLKNKAKYLLKEIWGTVCCYKKPLVLSIAMLAIIEAGRDLGSVIVISLMILGMYLVAGGRLRVLCSISLLLGIPGVVALCIKEPYRIGRILSWASMNSKPTVFDLDHQIQHSLISVASGGMFGRGISHGIGKFGYLPECHTDFIYPVLCEELGFVGTLGIVLLFVSLCWAGLNIAMKCRDNYRAMVAFGITLQIMIQVMVNLGVVLGILPNKGLPLPFISYSGSAMLMILIDMGILMRIGEELSIKNRAPVKKSKPRQRRSGATLSSSESGSAVYDSSSAWYAVREKSNRRGPRMPHPAVDTGWTREAPIQPYGGSVRQRLYRRQAR